MDTFSGEATLSNCFSLPSEKGSSLKGKNLLPMGANYFPFRVDLLSEGTWCAGLKTGSQKSCLLWAELSANIPSVTSHLILWKVLLLFAKGHIEFGGSVGCISD